MTEEQLINDGWKPELCKIGTLYFKGNYFCRLDDETATVFSKSNDMTPLGTAKTFEEMEKIQMTREETDIIYTEFRLKIMIKAFKEKYGVAPKSIANFKDENN